MAANILNKFYASLTHGQDELPIGDVLPNKIHTTKPSMESVYTKMEFYKHHSVFTQVRCIVTRNNFKKLNNLAIKKNAVRFLPDW